MKKAVKYGQSRGRNLTVFEIKVHSILKKILKGLREGKEIHSFLPVSQILKNKLGSFRIFLSEDKFFEVAFLKADSFNPRKGVEIGSRHGRLTVIFLGRDYSAHEIRFRIREEIKERKSGLETEKICHNAIQHLIEHDREVRAVISSTRISTDVENRDYKIDLFLNTTRGDKVPLQIKSSKLGRALHKANDHNVPSLVFRNGKKTSELKNKILLICKSYPRIIEHL